MQVRISSGVSGKFSGTELLGAALEQKNAIIPAKKQHLGNWGAQISGFQPKEALSKAGAEPIL
jgi:hypothetical protein